jgi:hypothetical protein
MGWQPRQPFVEPVKLLKIRHKRREPEPDLVAIMPADPYRGRIRFVAKVVRPRTWRGRLRSLWRRLRVALGGKWRSRFERCSVCRRRHNGPRGGMPSVAVLCCSQEKEKRLRAARPLPRAPVSRLAIEGKPVLPQEGSPEWEMLSAFFERYKL